MGAPELCDPASRRVCLYTVALAYARKSTQGPRTFTQAVQRLRSYVQRPRIRRVHIRRALLLFAIVLGMAALVASFSRPAEQRTATERSEEPGPATAAPAPVDNPPRPISFDASSREQPAPRAGSRRDGRDRRSTSPAASRCRTLDLPRARTSIPPPASRSSPHAQGAYAILFRPADGDRSRRGRHAGRDGRRVRRLLGASALAAAFACGCGDDAKREPPATARAERPPSPQPRRGFARRAARPTWRAAESPPGASSTWSEWTPMAMVMPTSCLPRVRL